MAKLKIKLKIDYVQVNADSGDEHDIEDNRYNRQLIDRNQAQIASTSHSFPTCDTLDSTEPLNDSRPTIVDDIIDMGTNTAPPINDADNGNRTANNWDKFRLLMWKNSLLQWRHKIQTVVEILVPVLFSVILIFIRSMVDPDYYSEPTNYEPFEINTIDPLRHPKFQSLGPLVEMFLRNLELAKEADLIREWKVVYSPKNDQLDDLLAVVAEKLQLDGFIGVENENEIAAVMTNQKLIAAIEFKHPADIIELPTHLMYSLRFPSELRTPPPGLNQPLIFNWHTNLLYPLFSTGGPRQREDNDGGMLWYFREGFVPLQDAIARAFTDIKCNASSSCDRTELPEILMQRYPYPPYTFDVLLQGLETIVSFFILLSFIYPTINTVRFIAIEKERQLKEAMKIMGLPNWLHWLSWFIRTMLFMMISITCIVALLKTKMFHASVSVFTHSDWTTIWMFLFVFSITMTTYCFMLSVFFSKANTAAAVAGLTWFILYVPFSFTQQNYEQMSMTSKLIVCLSSNTAMAYGFQLILRFEGLGEGLQWDNFWRPVTVDDQLSVGITMLLMLLSSCVYMVIALYVERVMPGNYGVPEKWYFPFSKEFWFGMPEYKGVVDSADSTNGCNDSYNKYDFEPDPVNRRAGIRVKNLRKVYSNKKVACHGLSLNMFDDQITVLLGHNGAGKTTTMSMLTGMFPPTSGTAIINGYDIRANLAKARSSIGLCPQHNILFDELTVREHIIFYGRLKGLGANDIEEEVTKYVNLLELQPKINAMSSSLSGGMKRKLSVCVALCGRSRVVFCDEPSSGMDPAARRALWDVLQAEKKGRTILLTTHFMDEADVLGDRIAIMADGDLKCCGSSFFLKKRFGTGYHLICVKNEGCESNNVTNVLREYIPNISIESEIGSELTYELPNEYVNKFEVMFERLEDNQDTLNLGSYGVSLTTLEEVFLKIGSDSTAIDPAPAEEQQANGIANGNNHGDGELFTGTPSNASTNGDTTPLLRGLSLRTNQWYAMLKKKAICWKRTWTLFLLQNLIPVTFVVISVIVVHMVEQQIKLPDLDLSLDTYGKTVTMVQNPGSSESNQINRIVTAYKDGFKGKSDDELDASDGDIRQRFLKLAETLLVRLNVRYLAGLSVDSNSSKIIGWFNNQPMHTLPLSINLIHNAMVRSKLGADHAIHVTNSPLPFKLESRVDMLLAGNNIGFQLATNISFAMAFVSAFYAMFYIKEKESKAKLLQFVSGVNVSSFWITSFIFDFITYISTAFLVLATIFAFQEDGWSTMGEILPAFVALVLFGFAMLPITYLLSRFFSIPSSGFVRMTIFYIFTGITVFFVIMAMSFPAFKLADKANALKWFFLIFPHYSLSSSLNNLNTISTMERVCETRCRQMPFCDRKLLCAIVKECCPKGYYDWEEPGIGRNLVYMSVTGVGFFIILLIIEYRVFEGVIYYVRGLFKRNLPERAPNDELDDDVANEKQKVAAMTKTDQELHNLVLCDLSKFYGKFLAVNQLSIAIKHSECFGLLGVNGAGKTTTFKMLTGDVKISSGEGFVRGISLKNNMPTVHKVIGYCPQFDALIEDMTGRETLEMFALLRGVRRRDINVVSIRLATDLNFMKHIDKKVSEYSGGNKRKLSTAVALLGNPSVVYLDEPTTGMDPGAKRNLWNVISKTRIAGKSIVLTSHSMEECEALCTRLAIMVNGEFKCLGSTQHLKSKFSKGFLLTVKVRKNSEFDIISQTKKEMQLPTELQIKIIQVKDYVARNFSDAELKEEYQGLLTYYVPPTSTVKWSKIFGIMETGKKTLHIEDYSISQTSLEQVFLSFTKFQREEARQAKSPTR